MNTAAFANVNPWVMVLGAGLLCAVLFEVNPNLGGPFLILVTLSLVIYGYNNGWGNS